MTIAFSCPQCDKRYKVDDDKAGKRTTCPNCKTVLTVPAAASVTPPTPPPIEPANPFTVPIPVQQEPVNPFTVPMPVQQEPDNPFTVPMPVQQEPDNPFTVPLPAHTAQPQPAGKATNWDGGEILGGVLGGSAGFVIGAMIARNIILENPNLTMTEVTKTASLFPGYPPIPTQHIVLPNGGGLGVFLVITLVFTVFGMFIGEKIGKKK